MIRKYSLFIYIIGLVCKNFLPIKYFKNIGYYIKYDIFKYRLNIY